MIQLREVSKKFGQRLAVDSLTLRVPAGEIFGLLGHNGAGKSTAIGLMLGQVWPTAGEVKICGHDIAASRRLALQKVGAIFETPVFYDYLSGWRNLEILSHYTARCAPGRIREVYRWVGLSGREKGAVKTYSHGMRARLALAQALLPQPELLILDEPGDGLDPEGIHEMRQTILRLRRELGLTILLSSHLLSEMGTALHQHRRHEPGADSLRRGHGGNAAGGRLGAPAHRQFRPSRGHFARGGVDRGGAGGKVYSARRRNRRDQIVEQLVERRQPVFEIAPEAETLENFYLSLMRK